MKILLTGSTGYIGKMFLSKYSENFDISTLSRNSDSCPKNHKYDGSFASVLNAIEKSKPDIIIHFASLFIVEHKSENIGELIDSNVLLGTQIVEAMRALGINKMINIGTSWQNYESDTYRPVNLYAATKEAFQKIIDFYVDAFSLRVLTLKFPDTYGPKDNRPKIMNYIVQYSKSGETLGATPGNQQLDFVYIDDVLEAISHSIKLLEKMEGHSVYSLTSNNPQTLREIVEVFNTVSDKKIKVDWGKREYRNREVMTVRIPKNILPGWSAKTGLKDGIKKIIE